MIKNSKPILSSSTGDADFVPVSGNCQVFVSPGVAPVLAASEERINGLKDRLFNSTFKIPIQLPFKIHTSGEFRALAIFHYLKAIFSTSTFKYYTRQQKEICEAIGISQRTLVASIATLKRMGLIKKEGKRLNLVSYNKYCEILNVNQKYFIRINSTNKGTLRSVNDLFNYIVVRNNIEQQEWKINQKLIEAEVGQMGPIRSDRTLRRVRKCVARQVHVNPEHYAQKYRHLSTINFETVLSGRSTANKIGKRSQSTGRLVLMSLRDQGLLSITPRKYEFNVRSRDEFRFIKRVNNLSSIHLLNNGAPIARKTLTNGIALTKLL